MIVTVFSVIVHGVAATHCVVCTEDRDNGSRVSCRSCTDNCQRVLRSETVVEGIREADAAVVA